MSAHSHFVLMASYNQWMDERLYDAAARLPTEALRRDRRAFFGSIIGTLNHLVVADTIWLKRFATLPANADRLAPIADLPKPSGLDQILFRDLDDLRERRRWLDSLIQSWIDELSARDLDAVLSYRNSRGKAFNKRLAHLLDHFFNHQTHHRGQATTLLTQAGEDVGVTDLLALLPDELPDNPLA